MATATTTFLDLIPLYQESAVTVRARMDADVNAGLDEADPSWLDTREGTFYWDVTQPFVLEIARLWDAIGTEVIAAAMPVLAWGQYLDLHAAALGLERKPPVAASGTVVFTGDPGTLVSVGTIVSADPVDDDSEDTAVEFETTESGVTSGGLLPPEPVSPTENDVGGALLAATYTYSVTAYNEFGETDGSADAEAVVTSATGKVVLDWPDVGSADGYRVYRGVEDGTKYRIADVVASTYTDNGGQALVVEGPPDTNSTAGVELEVIASTAGIIGNVAARAITNIDTPNDGINGVSNPNPLLGGLEEESDDALRGRVLARYAGQGGGNITDYELWALDFPGVGRVSVIPLINGPGTVGVVALQEDGTPVGIDVVNGLQAFLDPVTQQGKGRAPIGHDVDVSTPAIRTIEVGAHVAFADGYSLDGAGGTTALRTAIEQSLSDYIDQLGVGEDVIYERVKSQFFRVPGITNINTVTVEGAGIDVDITTSPAQVARRGVVTLTAV